MPSRIKNASLDMNRTKRLLKISNYVDPAKFKMFVVFMPLTKYLTRIHLVDLYSIYLEELTLNIDFKIHLI